ncbi:MAG: tyrosine-type recombinase/integrase [Oscillospiraceae bacterium]|nr:tyrosine-type recombinase/integrase [Oscillospiraceae bacterium]
MAKTRTAEALWIESRQRWQINVQRDGKRRTFVSSTPGRRGKREAETKADEWLDAGQPDDMRFDVAWGEYVTQVKDNTRTSNYKSLDSIGRTWFLSDEKFCKKKLSKLTTKDLQTIITSAGKSGLSRRTIKNIRDKFGSFLRYADSRHWEYSIEMEYIQIPTDAKVEEKKIIQPDKLKILFSTDLYIDHGKPTQCFYIHAYRFLVVTGYRRGELCGFLREDYQKPVLTVNRAINELGEVTAGKNDNARRTNVLSQHAQKILEDQEAMLKARGIISPWLFPAPDGGRLSPTSLYSTWRKGYGKHHGMDVSLHELRHTFVTIAKLEMPEALLKDVVGHGASMDTFGVYGHEIDGDKQRAADIIDNIFNRILQL